MAVEHQKLTAHLPAFLQPVAGEDLVRIGSAGDGGYVVSRAMLDGARFLLSFGLGDDWAFEAAICDSLPVTATVCHAYDRTTSPEMLTAANRDELVASYEALFDGNRAVHFRQHVGVENNASTVSLANALSRIPQGVPVLLKMDIEGSEYALLDEIANDPKSGSLPHAVCPSGSVPNRQSRRAQLRLVTGHRPLLRRNEAPATGQQTCPFSACPDAEQGPLTAPCRIGVSVAALVTDAP